MVRGRFAADMKRIGILGGTFDPVHTAHLELAQVALDTCDLDVVLFIPTGQPVRKLGTTHASALDRLHMLEEACKDLPGFEVSPLEIERQDITYTIDTLHQLKELYGFESQLFLILGEDTATDLGTWKDAEQIAQLVTILYAKRPGGEEGSIPEGFKSKRLPMKARNVSSSGIREILNAGGEVSDLIPPGALEYIKEHGLYGKP